MAELCIVQHSDPRAFLDAVQSYDENCTNLPIGTISDRLDPAFSEGEEPWIVRTAGQQVFRTVWKGEELVLMLVRPDDNFVRIIAAPRGALERSPDDVMHAVRMLASELFQMTEDPKSFDKLFGPAILVDVFFEAWAAQLPSRGLTATLTAPEARRWTHRSAFASLASLPSFNPTPLPIVIAPAKTEEDAVAVAEHVVAFTNHIGIWQTTLEEATAQMRVATRMGQLWLCRTASGGHLAGYVLTGRATPRTVAYRNVYVLPEYRRKGIAEAMVTRITRWFLGAEPTGLGDIPPRKDGWRPKEVCLNVVEDNVARIYARCGFLLSEGDKDPESGFPAAYESLELRPKYSEIQV